MATKAIDVFKGLNEAFGFSIPHIIPEKDADMTQQFYEKVEIGDVEYAFTAVTHSFTLHQRNGVVESFSLSDTMSDDLRLPLNEKLIELIRDERDN